MARLDATYFRNPCTFLGLGGQRCAVVSATKDRLTRSQLSAQNFARRSTLMERYGECMKYRPRVEQIRHAVPIPITEHLQEKIPAVQRSKEEILRVNR